MATSKTGAIYWAELDWKATRKDGGQHMMNPAGGDYLHVRCKYSRDMDGPRPCPLDHRRWYRVRCAIAIGCRWRGSVVTAVNLRREKRAWVWEVISSVNADVMAAADNKTTTKGTTL